MFLNFIETEHNNNATEEENSPLFSFAKLGNVWFHMPK